MLGVVLAYLVQLAGPVNVAKARIKACRKTCRRECLKAFCRACRKACRKAFRKACRNECRKECLKTFCTACRKACRKACFVGDPITTRFYLPLQNVLTTRIYYCRTHFFISTHHPRIPSC